MSDSGDMHPHADNMALFAMDALETNRPWERWEVWNSLFQRWENLACSPRWNPNLHYRRKGDSKPKEYQMPKGVWHANLEDKQVYVTTDDNSSLHEAGLEFHTRPYALHVMCHARRWLRLKALFLHLGGPLNGMYTVTCDRDLRWQVSFVGNVPAPKTNSRTAKIAADMLNSGGFKLNDTDVSDRWEEEEEGVRTDG